MPSSAEVQTTPPQSTGAPELVKGLGLTSATTLVMGSMIGSGIFIVSAEIAREVNSPALLIGAWLVTGFMTIVGALSYGELAAMMPRAGGQYVYLRESLGPLWGFLYGWTLFLVIQTGTVAAVGVAFGKFLGFFFPSRGGRQTGCRTIPRWRLGAIGIALGGMDMGLNTQNLSGIDCRYLLTRAQYLWAEDRSGGAEYLYHRQSFGAGSPGICRNFCWPQRTGRLRQLYCISGGSACRTPPAAPRLAHLWECLRFWPWRR